ncbi:hypothetical protein NDU88_001511 [Pleurodeles waltl]|uniref:Uncharacterized protein n=1 Tax=Pleurodeles waltl TaxID=8319 RepID=A0AAV7T076_PLEWA|nr:hypothetical protein NDU88_001511 [Pleurodeles waltl]
MTHIYIFIWGVGCSRRSCTLSAVLLDREREPDYMQIQTSPDSLITRDPSTGEWPRHGGYNILRKQQSGRREISARRPRPPESKMATVTADRPARKDAEQKARSESESRESSR